MTPPEAPRDCPLCPRLVAYRRENAARHPDWFNGAVPSFGDARARLLVLGLAPGVAGANRTGRPFTGDFAGELLYATLTRFGFANGRFAADPADGLALTDCIVSNAVRCVPPQNKPTPAEIATCRDFLAARLAALPRLRVDRLPRPHRPRDAAAHPRPPPRRAPFRPRRPARDRPAHRLRQLPLLALQHQHRPPDRRDVRSGLRRGPRQPRPPPGLTGDPAWRPSCDGMATISCRAVPPCARRRHRRSARAGDRPNGAVLS